MAGRTGGPGPLCPRRLLIRIVMSNTTLSHLEQIKADSRHLRGSIEEGLNDPVTGAISDDDNKLLKFHGSYQQDDRDIRDERRKQKLEPAHAFMIRARLPGGIVTPAQWLARSEEHTSELQSLMRISYAVFCLKKKKKQTAHKQYYKYNS